MRLYVSSIIIIFYLIVVSSVDDIYVSQHLASIGLMLLLSLSLFKVRSNKITNSSILFCGLAIYYLTHTLLISTYESLTMYQSPAIWFILVFLLISHPHFNLSKRLICIMFSVGVFIQILFSYAQLFGLIDISDNSYFTLCGTLTNPGALSGYLSVSLPLLLSTAVLLKKKTKYENLFYIFIALILFSLQLIISADSRGGWIATIVSCGYFFLSHYDVRGKLRLVFNSKLKVVLVALSVFLIICVSSYYLYQYKADSAYGRTLIWRVTLQSPQDNIIIGDGVGSFEANYGKWQSAYFASENVSEKDKLVAGYVGCAYNEWLQIYKEMGIFGILLWTIVVVIVSRYKCKTIAQLGAKSSLFAFFLLSLVSYPLEVNAILFNVVLCIFILVSSRKGLVVRCVSLRYLHCLLFVAVCALLYGYSQLCYGTYIYRGSKEDFLTSNDINAYLTRMDYVHKKMSKESDYVYDYASALIQCERYEKAIEVLDRGLEYSSNPGLYKLLGDAYEGIQELDKAEEMYRILFNMIPHKLLPKYYLLKLMQKQNRKDEVVELSKQILSCKEKVHTTVANRIKDEVQQIIYNYDQQCK